MFAEILVLVALPLLLAVAAGWDMASFTIPNFLNLALLAAFAAFAVAAGLSFPVIGWHLLAGVIALAIGFTLFALGHIGGGDAKLFAVVVLWLGLKDSLPYALVASVFGGALALGLMLLRSWPLPVFLARQSWIMKLHDKQAGIPLWRGAGRRRLLHPALDGDLPSRRGLTNA
jgi:prepilin peptidase CpaA